MVSNITFNCIGILGHPLRPEAAAIGEQVAKSLTERGISTWTRMTWEAPKIESLIRESDMVIAIGGDGAMLRAGRLCGLAGVPIFGINAGHLGFLTEANPPMWDQALESLLAHRFWIEERMMIHSEVWRGGEVVSQDDALNDIVIGRGASARLVLLDMFVNGQWVTTYYADGLIVATPTGSTAYALAVGGPILPPELKSILVVPVAPHLTLDRPLVLSEGVTVEVVVSKDHQANVILTVDGEGNCPLQENDVIMVRASERASRFIRLRDRNYFYRSILDRMEPKMPVRRREHYESRFKPEIKIEDTE
ncbi:MAG: NAD(+)/NADH kinase [Anaerolineae bacterium]|nr:NAD(+)/NADH kinase [Anaerolineae bacterium]